MPWSGAIARWLSGELELEVAVADPAGFLSGLLGAGVAFRRARRAPGGVRLLVRLRDVRRLRAPAFSQRARVHFRRRRGAPFLLGRLRRRPFLVAAAAAAALALYLLSGFVWFVQVQGVGRVDPAEILHAVAALGLRPGVWRDGVNAERVAARLPTLLPDLSWAAVTLQGTLATVQVVERERARPAYEQAAVPGDVVAAYGGIVTGITVSSGQAVVAPGDTVRPGQVLIRGVALLPAARGSLEPPRETQVHAAGVVIARRWYSAYAEAPRTLTLGVPTGRVRVRRSLLLGRLRLPLGIPGGPPFAAYVAERQVSGPWRWRNITLPVESTTVRYTEVVRHLRRLSVPAAGDMAAAEARLFLIPHLPPHARVIEERQRIRALPGDRVGVELQVESEDNIGVFRPVGAAGGPQGAR